MKQLHYLQSQLKIDIQCVTKHFKCNRYQPACPDIRCIMFSLLLKLKAVDEHSLQFVDVVRGLDGNTVPAR